MSWERMRWINITTTTFTPCSNASYTIHITSHHTTHIYHDHFPPLPSTHAFIRPLPSSTYTSLIGRTSRPSPTIWKKCNSSHQPPPLTLPSSSTYTSYIGRISWPNPPKWEQCNHIHHP